MRAKNHSVENSHGLRIAWIFCLSVFLLIAIALLFKIAVVWQNNIFDGKHRVTIAVMENPTLVISFAPDSKNISVVSLLGGKNSDTREKIEHMLYTPIDGVIVSGTTLFLKENMIDRNEIEQALQNLILHYPQVKTNLTFIDVIRLWFFVKSVDPNAVIAKSVSMDQLHTDQARVDKTISSLFPDASIALENISIQIVNGTGISGFGNDFARVLTNSGANVVSVITSRREVAFSTIRYYGNYSYTVEKIQKILVAKAKPLEKRNISDIIIVIGKDRGQ